jgi:hypothetical protein
MNFKVFVELDVICGSNIALDAIIFLLSNNCKYEGRIYDTAAPGSSWSRDPTAAGIIR